MPIDIGTNGSPRGYWEFLPTAYTEEPDTLFPVVIFFHGLGEGGNGTTDLHEVLGNGPPSILNTPTHDLYDLFEDEGVIVLSPQVTNNTWWNENHIRPFLDFVLTQYRIDTRRIYFTGLSAGSSGIHEFLNDDPNANQITAAMTVAVRGSVNDTTGALSSSTVPYWALTAIGDASNTATNSVNRIAAQLSGLPSDVRSNYPNGTTKNQTASFDVDTGTWSWSEGVVPFVTDKPHPKLTLYPGGSHNSWSRTYNNVDCWSWLLDQVKPEIRIAANSRQRVIEQGQGLTLEGTVLDVDGVSLSTDTLGWESNLAGDLGDGGSLLVEGLDIGVHEITASYVDSGYRGSSVTTTATVLRSGSYRAYFDFGDNGFLTPGNWNNITDRIAGSIDNAVADDGSSTGISAKILLRFDGIQTGGQQVDDIYPVTAQRDTMFISATYPRAEILFSGLNPNQTYTFTIFASRIAGNDRTGTYTINDTSINLNAANNENQTAVFADVFSNEFGEVTLSIERAGAAAYAYLGVVEIYTDGLPADEDNLPNLWEMRQFGNLSELPEGDFDGDGVKNLIEYALGSSANDSANHYMPAFRLMENGSSNPRLFEYSFRRRVIEPFIEFQPLVSSDMDVWLPLNLDDYDVEISAVPGSDPAMEIMTLTQKETISPPPLHFMKLEIKARE
ncbi:hypothetical protein [Rubellicoccus peritrichatus]|uniref:Uncharacterized protein n=1 Tax=Rubellicoccus peritrichatus TaxID=3080537 RepID=A0AAQ3L9I2_9BACT|nr:hypothetical protein [Puniceicoccus sp. CR14]WOO40162.1 hypothetical protein RZN69_16190 [Puniceicoccus sp. CR14]